MRDGGKDAPPGDDAPTVMTRRRLAGVGGWDSHARRAALKPLPWARLCKRRRKMAAAAVSPREILARHFM